MRAYIDQAGPGSKGIRLGGCSIAIAALPGKSTRYPEGSRRRGGRRATTFIRFMTLRSSGRRAAARPSSLLLSPSGRAFRPRAPRHATRRQPRGLLGRTATAAAAARSTVTRRSAGPAARPHGGPQAAGPRTECPARPGTVRPGYNCSHSSTQSAPPWCRPATRLQGRVKPTVGLDRGRQRPHRTARPRHL